MKKNFGMLGASGFVAPRHMKAIHSLGHQLKAACDPYDGVGVLDLLLIGLVMDGLLLLEIIFYRDRPLKAGAQNIRPLQQAVRL